MTKLICIFCIGNYPHFTPIISCNFTSLVLYTFTGIDFTNALCISRFSTPGSAHDYLFSSSSLPPLIWITPTAFCFPTLIGQKAIKSYFLKSSSDWGAAEHNRFIFKYTIASIVTAYSQQHRVDIYVNVNGMSLQFQSFLTTAM